MEIHRMRNRDREETCHGAWFRSATAWCKPLRTPQKIAEACNGIFKAKITEFEVAPYFKKMESWQKDALAMSLLWLNRKPGRQGSFKELFNLVIDRQYQWTPAYLNSRLIVRQRFIKTLEETFPPLPLL